MFCCAQNHFIDKVKPICCRFLNTNANMAKRIICQVQQICNKPFHTVALPFYSFQMYCQLTDSNSNKVFKEYKLKFDKMNLFCTQRTTCVRT